VASDCPVSTCGTVQEPQHARQASSEAVGQAPLRAADKAHLSGLLTAWERVRRVPAQTTHLPQDVVDDPT
jgi:hypothetical protein